MSHKIIIRPCYHDLSLSNNIYKENEHPLLKLWKEFILTALSNIHYKTINVPSYCFLIYNMQPPFFTFEINYSKVA